MAGAPTQEEAPPAPRSRASRPLRALAFVLPIILFVAATGFDYRLQLTHAREYAAVTTDTLAEHAQTVVETANLVIGRTLDHIDGEAWPTIAASRETHEFLARLKAELPAVQSIFLVDPSGANAASSRIFPMPVLSDADRDYFVNARDGNTDLFVSVPFRGQLSGDWGFTITRPRLRDGRFDGVVGVTMSLDYFEKFYSESLAYSAGGAAALLRDDGTILIRVPPMPGPQQTVPPDNPLMRALAAGAPSGVLETRSAIDGAWRLGAFKRLRGVPLVVGYGLDRHIILRPWFLHVSVLAGFATLFGFALWLAERTVGHRVAQEQAALQRLLVETQRRQQAEQALLQMQKMEALGRLTGGVAHDFNNLLTAVLGSLELLGRHVNGERAQRLLVTARQAAERGARLTAQMLAFSRRQDITVQAVDVNAAIREMDSLIHHALGPAVQLDTDLATDAWPAMADPTQLEMALLNLLANARDAMPLGGMVRMVTRCINVPGDEKPDGVSPGDYLRLSVADTGEGMSEETRTRAFEPFFTTKEPGKGTGLGLSMVFGFVALVGGAVLLDSAPGRGTTITLYLRRADARQLATKVKSSAARPAPRVRILLIDDDEDVRNTIATMLEDLGHSVTCVGPGQAALDMLAQDRGFALVILDYAMPGMNGGQLATRIRADWPDAKLLFITGYAEHAGLQTWLERGVRKLGKPFSRAELADAITATLP